MGRSCGGGAGANGGIDHAPGVCIHWFLFSQSSFQLTQAAAALVITASNAGQIITIFVFGMCIDRYGERRVVGFTMAAMGVTAILAAATNTSYGALLAWLTLLGAMYASIQPGRHPCHRQLVPSCATRTRNRHPASRGRRRHGAGRDDSSRARGSPRMADGNDFPGLRGDCGWFAVLRLVPRPGMRFIRQAQANSPPLPNRSPRRVLKRAVRRIAGFRALWPVMLAGIAMVMFQFTFATFVISFLTFRFHVSIVGAALLFSISQWVGRSSTNYASLGERQALAKAQSSHDVGIHVHVRSVYRACFWHCLRIPRSQRSRC